MSQEEDSGSECSEMMEIASIESRYSRSPTPDTYTVEEFLQLREENKRQKTTIQKLQEQIQQLQEQLKKQEEAAEVRHQQLENHLLKLLAQTAKIPKDPTPPEKAQKQVRAATKTTSVAKEQTEATKNPNTATTKTATGSKIPNEAETAIAERGNKRKLTSPGPSSEEEIRNQPQKQPRTATAKENTIPPVVVRKKETWTQVAALLKREKVNYTKAKLIKDGVAVTPASANDHRKMTSILNREKQEFHTYSLYEEKLLRVVIRGIPNGVAAEDIAEDLREQGLTPKAVHRMTSRRTKQQMPLILVQVPQDQTKILEVTRCCGLVVRTEAQKQQTGASQCHRCQKFGHGQGRCTAQARCVKCGEDHETSTCTKSRDAQAKCANCSGPHPASYRGCPAFPKLPTRKPENRTRTTTKQQTRTQNGTQVTPPKTTPSRSYAEAAKPTRAQAGAVKGAQNTSETTDLATLAAQFAKMQEALSLLTTFIKNMPPSLQVHG